ncbi:hypothetical protein SAMN04489841_1375 [Natrinema salaciae]|uniref:Uncharacterized protein n=1 Tax=Natrinema salaciae TaxID=1186196 RepID=A0A1H9ESW6_9EURY|nr:hypothetical protein SAMN04489841_1375 [Natrinema salaciae]
MRTLTFRRVGRWERPAHCGLVGKLCLETIHFDSVGLRRFPLTVIFCVKASDKSLAHVPTAVGVSFLYPFLKIF